MSATHDVFIALIAVIPVVTINAVRPYFENRAQERREQRQWARDDELAARAARLAKHSIEQNEKILAKQDVAVKVAQHTATIAANAAASTARRLQSIHDVIGMATTPLLEQEHDSLTLQLALLNEIVVLREGNPTEQTLQGIRLTQDRLNDIEAELDRRRATGDQGNGDTT